MEVHFPYNSEVEQVAVSAASAQHFQDMSAETISSFIGITHDSAGLHTHLHRTDNMLNMYALRPSVCYDSLGHFYQYRE